MNIMLMGRSRAGSRASSRTKTWAGSKSVSWYGYGYWYGDRSRSWPGDRSWYRVNLGMGNGICYHSYYRIGSGVRIGGYYPGKRVRVIRVNSGCF